VVNEIHGHVRSLERLSDLDRYGGDFLFPLANLYGLAKRVAMLANSRVGVSTFQRERALRTCADLYPQAAPDLNRIAALAPFYAQTRGVCTAYPPFSSDGAHSQLLGCTSSLQRVVDRVTVG